MEPKIPRIVMQKVFSQIIHQLQVQELVMEFLSIAIRGQNLNNHNP